MTRDLPTLLDPLDEPDDDEDEYEDQSDIIRDPFGEDDET